MPKDPNEVGAGWDKESTRGAYISVQLDLEHLLELTGGATGKVDLNLYPIDFEKSNPKAPDHRLKFYVRRSDSERSAPARPVHAPPPPIDDDIPFAWMLPLLLPLSMAVGLAHVLV